MEHIECLTQTPQEVIGVRTRARLKQVDCDNACGFPPGTMARAEFNIEPLTDTQWSRLKIICYARGFDSEMDATSIRSASQQAA
jgi:hypothetical protein